MLSPRPLQPRAVYTCVFHALMAPYLTVDVILHQANGPLIFLKYVCLCFHISNWRHATVFDVTTYNICVAADNEGSIIRIIEWQTDVQPRANWQFIWTLDYVFIFCFQLFLWGMGKKTLSSPPFLCINQLYVLLYTHKCSLWPSSQLNPSTHVHCPSARHIQTISVWPYPQNVQNVAYVQRSSWLAAGVGWNINCRVETFIDDLQPGQQSLRRRSFSWALMAHTAKVRFAVVAHKRC